MVREERDLRTEFDNQSWAQKMNRVALSLVIAFTALMIVVSVGPVYAESITINWTAAGDDGSSGQASQYDIRFSTTPLTEANWNQAFQADNEPTPKAAGSAESYAVDNLLPGNTYYIALKVADEVPNWSAMSNVLIVQIPEDSVTLEITIVQILNVTDSSFDMVWATNELSTSQVYYGQTTALGYSSSLNASLSTGHAVRVTGLLPETAYYMRAASRDSRGNEVQSPYYQIATQAAVAPPVAINDLEATTGEQNGEIDLRWTVPGEVVSYAIGYSSEIINEINWNLATLCDNPPVPADSGTMQSYTLCDLEFGEVYYIAVVSFRADSTMSLLSNVDSAVSKFSIIADVEDDDNGLPSDFELAQNYPNPFNPSTTIEFSIPTSSHVRLTVFNSRGQIVEVLANEIMAAGQHAVMWDGTGSGSGKVSSGVYFYRVEAGDYVDSRKMVLTK